MPPLSASMSPPFWLSCGSCVVIVDHVANEAAVGREFIVEAPGAIVVFPGVPVEPRPALRFHLGKEPVDQLPPDPAGTLRRVDEEILEIAYGCQRPRVLVDDVVGHADHAGGFAL